MYTKTLSTIVIALLALVAGQAHAQNENWFALVDSLNTEINSANDILGKADAVLTEQARQTKILYRKHEVGRSKNAVQRGIDSVRSELKTVASMHADVEGRAKKIQLALEDVFLRAKQTGDAKLMQVAQETYNRTVELLDEVSRQQRISDEITRSLDELEFLLNK